MALKLITPASTYPVSLAEAKLHLRVDDSAEDALITALIASATEMAEQATGRAVMAQTWEVTFDAFPSAVELSRVPVQSVTSVKYYDIDGVQQTVASNLYSVDTANDYGYAYVVPAFNTSWPATQDIINAVAVRYVAGYSTVPEPIKSWIKLAVGVLYENRANETYVSRVAAGSVKLTVGDRLLDRYKVVL